MVGDKSNGTGQHCLRREIDVFEKKAWCISYTLEMYTPHFDTCISNSALNKFNFSCKTSQCL